MIKYTMILQVWKERRSCLAMMSQTTSMIIIVLKITTIDGRALIMINMVRRVGRRPLAERVDSILHVAKRESSLELTAIRSARKVSLAQAQSVIRTAITLVILFRHLYQALNHT